jgi:uncharacterized protein with NAD-binding domain and iron-sulfur cluster
VLGGGAAGLAAAFELTDTDELRRRFAVTVYQAGWRLGGKGASGRRSDMHERIEEHGLHVWFGFYDDSFGLVRRAYEELAAEAPAVPWTEAFTPIERLVLWDRDEGNWRDWQVRLPATPLAEATEAVSADPSLDMVRRLTRLWGDFLDGIDEPWAMVPSFLRVALRVAEASPADDVVALRETARLLRLAVDAQKLLEQGLDLAGGAPFVLRLLNRLLDFWTGLLTGLVDDRVLRPPSSFDPAAIARLDELDLRDWLRPRLEFDDTLDWSFVRVLYDLAFAYRGGDPERPDVAAGMAVENLFRILFEHHGAVMLRMEGGMGDVIFAPIYNALRKRGVEFRFFHSVGRLRLAGDRRAIGAIDVVEQVGLAGDAYEPLVDVGADRCWPSRPLWDQLDHEPDAGEDEPDFEREADPLGRGTRELVRGRDFDAVVLAIPPGALSPMCEELAAARPRFATMLDNAHTVATQSLQLWLDRDAPALGLAPEPSAIAGGLPKPFDTYCDMSHLLPRERWPAGSPLTHIAYFCGVLPENPSAVPPRDRVLAGAGSLLSERGWDGADTPLIGADGGAGGSLDEQWWSANAQGAERYVITPAGSPKHRLAPGESGFANLALAGDWTRTPVNAGSVEAAVRSGRAAAAALIAEAPAQVRSPAAARSGGLRYVEYGGLTSAPGPLSCSGTTLYGFWANCRRDRLEELCRRVFEEPSGGAVRCVPLFDYAIITFGLIERIRPLTPPFDQMGEVAERHAAIWIPVRCRGPEGTPPVAVFLPYLWIDDPVSVASGREVYGYAKNWGWPRFAGDGITRSSKPGPPGRFELDAYAIEEFGAHQQPGRRRLLEITRAGLLGTLADWVTPDDLEDLVEIGRDTLGALRLARDELADAGGSLDALRQMLRSEVPQIFLRQFRAPEGGELASQLQIVVAPARIVEGTLKARTLGTHRLALTRLASHPLEEQLGLEAGPLGAAFRVQMDFTVESGRVLWNGR